VVYECLGPEPGALFDGDSWGTQQKGLLVADSSAPFSPSEVFNDSGTFPEVVVTVGEFFSGVVVRMGLLGDLYLLHKILALKVSLALWIGRV
jgi:hypothetical protein